MSGLFLVVCPLIFIISGGNFMCFQWEHLILLTKPKVRIDKLYLYDIWELKQVRISSIETSILQRPQPEIVNRIWQLGIEKKRKGGRRGGVVRSTLAHRSANFENLMTVLRSNSSSGVNISSNLVLAMFS